MSTRINHKLLRLPYNADFPLQFWIHPALPYRRQLTVVIEQHGGQVEPIRSNADVALVCTGANSTLSASLYVKLILADDIVVDPSWVVDCIAHNFLIDEGDYMPINLGSPPRATEDQSKSKDMPSSDDYPEDADDEERESGEFLLDVMLRLDSLDWPEIYSYCCDTHPKHHSVEYWRNLNISGYQLHSISTALRRDIREAQRTPAPSYEDSLRVVKNAYAPRTPITIIPTPVSTHDFRPKVGYSDAENACIRDVIIRHRDDADFQPNRQHWWEKAVNEFPQRDSFSLLKKFVSSRELKDLARFQLPQAGGSNSREEPRADQVDEEQGDNNDDGCGASGARDTSPNVKSSFGPGRTWTAEVVAALKTIIIRERTKPDFHPRGVEWCGRWSDELGGCGKWSIYNACHKIPEIAAEIPPQHHRRSITASRLAPAVPESPLRDDESDVDMSEAEMPTGTHVTARAARITYSHIELARMRSIVDRESSSPNFHPTSLDWWLRFESEFPGRRAGGLAQRWARLAAGDLAPHSRLSSSLANPLKRSYDEHSSFEVDTSDLSSIGEPNEEDFDESTQPTPQGTESELIAGMVRTVSTARRAAWSQQEIKTLIDALYKDGVSPQTFDKLAEQHGKRAGNWRLKWLKNRPTLQHILRMRRENDVIPSPNPLVENLGPKTPQPSQSPPKKRARISSDARARPITPSPSVTPPLLTDLEDEELVLKHAIKWFVAGIVKARPVGEAEVIDVWKQISNDYGLRLTKLLTLYCNNINIFEGLLNTITT